MPWIFHSVEQWGNLSKPPLWRKPVISIPMLFVWCGHSFPSNSHPLGYYITRKTYRFLHDFYMSLENEAKSWEINCHYFSQGLEDVFPKRFPLSGEWKLNLPIFFPQLENCLTVCREVPVLFSGYSYHENIIAKSTIFPSSIL